MWWSVAWSIAFCGWGIDRTALNITDIFGTTCNSSTRDQHVKMLTEGLADNGIAELSLYHCIIFALDNLGCGKDLHQMRGNRSYKNDVERKR